MIPSDTSVSIDAAPCRALRTAAAWNGHAAHPATGMARATRTHCQPGNLAHPNSDSTTDRSVSGTKNTSARISRRFRSATRAASVPAPPAASGRFPARTASAWYPACSTASISRVTGTDTGTVTAAFPVAKFTAAVTSSSVPSFFSTRAAHAAHVIPRIESSTSRNPAASSVPVTAADMPALPPSRHTSPA